jgi:hypothetical protein
MPLQFVACPQCGSRVPDDAPYCAKCGRNMRTGKMPPPMPPQQPQTPPRQSTANIPIQPPQPQSPPYPLTPQQKAAQDPNAAIKGFLSLVFLCVIGYVLFGSHCGRLIPLSGDSSSMRSKISFGMSESEVREAIGEPDSVQDMNTPGMHMRMLYYNNMQIAIENGRVTSINQY